MLWHQGTQSMVVYTPSHHVTGLILKYITLCYHAPFLVQSSPELHFTLTRLPILEPIGILGLAMPCAVKKANTFLYSHTDFLLERERI